MTRLAVEERFWPKVDQEGPTPRSRPELTPCWQWTGAINADGYGRFFLHGRNDHAHRVAWELASTSPVPPGRSVLHTCDIRACVRNDDEGVYIVDGIALPRWGHLFLGTHQDNCADMKAKGRWRRGLSPEAFAEVKRLHALGQVPVQALAHRFKVSRCTIYDALRGRYRPYREASS